MSLEIKTQQLSLGDNPVFTFSNTVQECLVGISYFRLGYGQHDFEVKEVSIGAQVVSRIGNSVQVSVSGKLTDGVNSQDYDDCKVTVVVVAWTGTSVPTLLLENGNASTQFTLPDKTCSTLASVLAGFDLAYEGMNNVHEIGVGPIAVQKNGTEATLTAPASMSDVSGHTTTTATFNAGVIASSEVAPVFEIQQLSNIPNLGSQALNFQTSWTNHVPIITGFNVAYYKGVDAWVEHIEVSLYLDSNNHVQGVAAMNDRSGNFQDAGTYVTGIVIGY